MSSEESLGSSLPPSPRRKPATSPISEMLSPSELESLRRGAKETSDFARAEMAKSPALPGVTKGLRSLIS